MEGPECVHDELGFVIVDVPHVDSEVEVRLEGGGHAQVVGLHPHLVDLLPLAVQTSGQGDLAENEDVKHVDDDDEDLVENEEVKHVDDDEEDLVENEEAKHVDDDEEELVENEEVKHVDYDEEELGGHLSAEGVHDEGEVVAQGVLPDTVPEGDLRRIKES